MKSSKQENPYNNFVIVESATKLHSYTTETLLQTFHLGLGVISKLYMQKPIHFAIINNKTPFTFPKGPPSSHSIHGKRNTLFSCMWVLLIIK